MQRLDRVISAFIRDSLKKTLTEELTDFVKDFLADIEKLTHYRIKKLSSSQVYIKDRLTANTIDNATRFCDDFNEYMTYHSEVWEEITSKFKSPKSIQTEDDWVKAISLFRKDINDHLKGLFYTASGLQENLQFIEENYEITPEQVKLIASLKNRLNRVKKINYSKFVESLFECKLLQI